jgi:TonB family protein
MTTSEPDRGFPSAMRNTDGLPYGVRLEGWRLAGVIVGYGACLMITLMIPGVAWWRHDALDPWWIVPLFLAGAAVCAWRLWLLRTPDLILYPDRLEKRGLTGEWRVMSRSGIIGTRKAGGDRYGEMFEVVPSDPSECGVILRADIRSRPIVKRWFEGCRDLTAEDIARDRAAVLDDPRYGADQSERARRLKLAKGVVIAFSVACVGVAVWILFTDYDYAAHLVAATGAVIAGWGLVRLSNGLIVWIKAKARPAAIACFAPAAAAAFKALDIHLISAAPLLMAAGACGVLAAVLYAVRKPGGWRSALGVAIFTGWGLYGVIVLTDVAPATGSAKVFARTVQDKFATGSRNRSYNLKLDAWDDQPGGGISVPVDFYDSVRVGSLVCVMRRHGALGFDWFEVHACPAGTPIPKPALPTPLAAASRPAPDAPYYPAAARDAGKEGKAVVRCKVYRDKYLTECRVLSETPPNLGFGAAALERLQEPGLSVPPGELKGRAVVDIPVNFKLEK